MTDLFDRLAARTLGAGVGGARGSTATVSARPRLPSRFEGSGAGGAALVVEDVAASARGAIAARPGPAPEPVPIERFGPVPGPAAAVVVSAATEPVRPGTPAAVPGSVEADGLGPRADQPAALPRGRSGVVRARPPAAAPIAPRAADGEAPARAAAPIASPFGTGHHHDPSHDSGPEPEPRALPRAAAAPRSVVAAPVSAASPAVSEAARGERAGSDGATIRVSIGRVEVRANLVAAPSPRPAPQARREDALALGDYLRGKRGGA